MDGMYFRNKVAKYMEGRNGIDTICYAAFAAYFILAFINAFFNLSIIRTAMTLIAVYIVFRIMSKNLAKRRSENAWFMRIISQIKSHGRQLAVRCKEIKTHRYRRCPHCKVMLRLPRKKGSHTVICPRCKERFDLKIII